VVEDDLVAVLAHRPGDVPDHQPLRALPVERAGDGGAERPGLGLFVLRESDLVFGAASGGVFA
jgi:hypothetical protein